MARLSNAGMSRRGSGAVLAPVPEGRASTATSREAPPAASENSGAAPSQPALSATAGALRGYCVKSGRSCIMTTSSLSRASDMYTSGSWRGSVQPSFGLASVQRPRIALQLAD